MIAEDDQQFGRGVDAHTEALTEGRRCLGREARGYCQINSPPSTMPG